MEPNHPPRQIIADPESDNSWRDRATLVDMCKRFMQVSIPESNVVPVDEFAKFIPLYKSGEMERIGPDRAREIAQQFQQTFSIRHAIKVYSPELTDADDKNGVYVKRDGQYHKVLYRLLPLVRSINTMNEIGVQMAKKADALPNEKFDEKVKIRRAKSDYDNLTTSLMNTASPENPLDHRAADYTAEISKWLKLANPAEIQIRHAQAFAAAEFAELERQKASTASRQSDSMTSRPQIQRGQEKPGYAPVSSDNKKPNAPKSMLSGLIDW